MKAAERLLRLRGIFERQEFADLATLARTLRTSESTVRRDLAALAKEGLVKRVHGGALAAPKTEASYDFAGQARRMAGAKARIARVAASLVEDGQMVILDGGSTALAEYYRSIGMEKVILKCLERDPEKRYPHMSVLIRDLHAAP